MANGYSNYSNTQSTAETVRESEAQALLRCALKMELAQDEAVDYFDYCFAVRQNQKLWTLFQASLIGPDSKLPLELSETLKSLSLYVDRRSLRAIGEFDKSLLAVLININRQIASGLMQRSEDAPVPQTTAPSTQSQGSLNIAG